MPNNPSDVAEIAGELVIQDTIGEGKINLRSPSASGRCAMAVYHSVFDDCYDAEIAGYWAEWWATDGGDLESVPDGTPPNDQDPDFVALDDPVLHYQSEFGPQW
jgi:hypothetical protein